MNTRSNEIVSAQIAKMGVLANIQKGDFALTDGQCFLIKNESKNPVELEVQLAQMEDGKFVKTKFFSGWNPEIVKRVKKDSALLDYQLKWGY